MRKYLLLFLIIPFFFGCTTNSVNNKNPYIPNYSVNFNIYLNLPEYSNLKFVSNPVYIPNQGVRGIIVFNNSGTTYNAFDAACPNQDISSCATPMTIKEGYGYARCTCDNAEYSLFTGQSSGKQYPMKQYRVEVNGDMLRVYN